MASDSGSTSLALLPPAWLPYVRLRLQRPAYAPGEWPEAIYAGRWIAHMDERARHLPKVPV